MSYESAPDVSSAGGLPRYQPATGGPGVTVRGLRKKFGDKEAVAGIDLEIAAGSLAGLGGPNGAGETTSLSMMTGVLRPDERQGLVKRLGAWAGPPAGQAIMGGV